MSTACVLWKIQIGSKCQLQKEDDIQCIVIWQSSDGPVYQVAPRSKPQKIANSLAEYILQ